MWVFCLKKKKKKQHQHVKLKKKKNKIPLLKKFKLTLRLMSLVYNIKYWSTNINCFTKNCKLGSCFFHFTCSVFLVFSMRLALAYSNIVHSPPPSFLRTIPCGGKITPSEGAVKPVCRESTVANHFCWIIMIKTQRDSPQDYPESNCPVLP